MQPDPGAGRLACFCRPTASAIVLGSTQSPAEIDDQRRLVRGLELVKRRSGGGAVVVTPAAQVWLDLFVPRDDPIYEDDVARAAYFVADLWASVLVSKAVSEASVDPIRAFAPTRFSRSGLLFRLGPGEVTVGGNKVVGVSQRRDRSGAWFFTMALLQNAEAPSRSCSCSMRRTVWHSRRNSNRKSVRSPSAPTPSRARSRESSSESPSAQDVPAEPHPAERNDHAASDRSNCETGHRGSGRNDSMCRARQHL